MTSNTLLKKLKTRFTLALIILGLLCASLFFFTACSKDETTDKIPSYSYTDNDDGEISNPTFAYGTADTELKNFPLTSPTGWSRSKDSTGKSSSAKSGIIDVSDDGWEQLLNSIYSDNYYLGFLKSEFGFTKDSVKEELTKQNGSATDEEVKTEIIDKYLSKITNPKTKDGAMDNKIYMLNNYTSDLGQGSAQKITSSKAITVDKGEYVKIEVTLLTQVIKKSETESVGMTGSNGADNFGASIRLSNTFNGSSQAEYAITNIDTNGEWKTYTLYVKGDSEFDSSVTLALGLGYNSEYQTQGTVYFDDIKVERLETLDSSVTFEDSKNFVYGATKSIKVNANNTDASKPYLYDMTLAVDTSYYASITPTILSTTEFFTKSDDGLTSKNKGWSSTITETVDSGKNVYTLKDASATIPVTHADFKVQREGYTYVSFKLNNKLNALGSTTVTVDVYEDDVKKPAVATITETGETTVGIMIKNNFADEFSFIGKTDEYASYDFRNFRIEIVVGPTVITSSDKISDYASGSVEISDFKIASGKTYQYIKDTTTGDPTDDETSNYKFYQLFNGIADGSTSLYNGFQSDYTASADESTASTGFSISATHREYLNKQPVAAKEYDGVVADHIYLKEESKNSKINERLSGNSDTSFAGVIDTQYLSSYTNTYLQTALSNALTNGLLKGEEDIRPLMIYNKDADSYGFVSNTEAKVIAANSYAKISIKVKVEDNANTKAFIYLVDTTSKEIMTFKKFNPNTDGLNDISDDEKGGDKFEFVVTNDTPVSSDGWVNVEFYVATGNVEKSFRVELWNGSRDGSTTSQGYVFFKSVDVSLSSAFTEPSFKDAFISTSSPLASAGKASFTDADNNPTYLCYRRELTDTEREFNSDYPENAISYSPKIVWAKNQTMLYAIYNNLDVEETDPYDTITEEDDESGSGCAAQTDPATFWLSFSSILLAVVLVLAIVMLFVKRLRRRRKANASDAKSHYTVKSRVANKNNKPAKPVNEEKNDSVDETQEDDEEAIEQQIEQSADSIESETETQPANEEQHEQTLDDYVYGDVQDFGDDDNKNE